VTSAQLRSIARPTGIALLAVGLIGLLVVDARNDTLREAVVDQTIAWWAVMFVGFAAAAWSNEGRPFDLRIIWIVAILARLVLLVTTPTLSDDVYRYLWEGHLVSEGVSPYAFVIEDPAGDALSIEARTFANNPSLASPYLPVAHGIFGAAAVVLPSEPWTMQALMVGFDLVAIAGLATVLARIGLPRHRLLLYAWNPLAIVEIAHGAHLDAMIIALATWGVVATLDHRKDGPLTARAFVGPLLIAAAILSRPIAILILPVLFWRWSWPQRLFAAVATVVPVVVTGSLVGFGLGENAGTGVFGSARAYVQTFRFNSAIYQRLEAWIGARGLDDQGWNEPTSLTRFIVDGGVAAALGGIFVTTRKPVDDRTRVRWLVAPLAVYAVATPVLHPWYLLLAIALAVTLAPAPNESVSRWWLVVPWPVLGALSTLTYLTYQDPDAFAERVWVSRVVWYPTFVLAAVALTMGRRLSKRASSWM